MNIIHIESGLGNQMLNYAEYLALKSVTDAACFIETMVYDISECNEGINQWNGYELERIFGIEAPNIKDYLGQSAYTELIDDVRKSEFWKRYWNYPPFIVQALARQGIEVKNIRGDLYLDSFWLKCPQIEPNPKNTLKHMIKQYIYKTRAGYFLKHNLQIKFQDWFLKNYSNNKVFIKDADGVFLSHCLNLLKKNSGIEQMEELLKKVFIFPEITEEKNFQILSFIQKSNSVSLHVRRGDFMAANSECFRYGYFKKAVRFMKRNVTNPVFFIFSDEDSTTWSMQHLKILGLNKSDVIYYINWNKGADSYRDMQLMSLCKHNIVTNSSFGWWAALLNSNKDKITCSPDITTYSTHVF